MAASASANARARSESFTASITMPTMRSIELSCAASGSLTINLRPSIDWTIKALGPLLQHRTNGFELRGITAPLRDSFTLEFSPRLSRAGRENVLDGGRRAEIRHGLA